MKADSLKTSVFLGKQSLVDFIDQSVPVELRKEKMILAITSKVVSVDEKRWISAEGIDKEELVRKEADKYLGRLGYDVHLTIKHGLLIPSAGIDESNTSPQGYLLFPVDPYKSAKNIGEQLCKRWDLKQLGILLTDSHTTPLRRGVTGVCLSFWGFNPVEDRRGDLDLFQRPVKYTTINKADALAATATLLMGETNEQRPLAIITDVDLEWSKEYSTEALLIDLAEDLYSPLLQKSEAIKPL